MMPEERYRRDLKAYGADIAGQLRDGALEPSTARTLQEDADRLEERAIGRGRTFDEAAQDLIAQLFPGEAPDLCPQCGAYWACDCRIKPDSFMGKPVKYVDDLPPEGRIMWGTGVRATPAPSTMRVETVDGQVFDIDLREPPPAP